MNRRMSLQLYCIFLIGITNFPHQSLSFSFLGGSKTPIIEVDSMYDIRPSAQHSLRAPYYLVRGQIPNWSMGGATVVSDEWIRLTPAEKSLHGFIWNQKPVMFDAWEAELQFKIWGAGSLGADGMAFWYTSQIPQAEGPTFGGPASWTGLAVLFDTFDNSGDGDQPSIGLYVNDGSWSYHVASDGRGQAAGACKNLFRGYEMQVKIQYFDGNLQVLSRAQGIKNEYELCARVKTNLPPRYYIGLTAATGGVTDNHDVLSLSFRRLVPKAGMRPGSTQDQPIEEVPEPQFEQPKEEIPEAAPPKQELVNDAQPKGTDRYDSVYQRLQSLKQKSDEMKKKDSGDNEPAHPHEQQKPYQPPQQQQQAANPAVPEPGVDQEFNRAGTENRQPAFTQPPQYNQQDQAAGSDPAISSLLQSLSLEVQNLKSHELQLENTLKSVLASMNDYLGTQAKNSGTLEQILARQAVFASGVEEMTKNERSASVQEVMQKIESVNSELQMIKTLVSSKTSWYDSTQRNLQSIVQSVNELKSRVEDTKAGQQQLSQTLRTNKEQLQETITSSSSYGFWTYFILFQISFGFAFMWWRKYRAESDKKLF